MKILHILKTEPDEATERLIAAMSEGEETEKRELFNEPVDYDGLVKSIFASDKVLSWW